MQVGSPCVKSHYPLPCGYVASYPGSFPHAEEEMSLGTSGYVAQGLAVHMHLTHSKWSMANM